MGSIKQVLVHIDDSPAAAQRLKLARRIAASHGGAVTALYGVEATEAEVPFAADVTTATWNAVRDVDALRKAAAMASFEIALAQAPGGPVEWTEVADGPVNAAFAQHALYADLTILPQHNRHEGDPTGVPVDLVETVVIGAGRPALVVPYIGWSEPVGNVVAIAWKPTREAMRAVRAALPLLRQAREVHVVVWGEDAPPGLQAWLEVRGIDATWHRDPTQPALIGEAILTSVADLDCDLLVMGCYSRSRASEWAFGGATRTILDSMTIPVVMAH